MKILQITYSDRGSEAAENALCLHRAFRKIGTGSVLLAARKYTREAGVELIPGRWGRFWDGLLGKDLENRPSGLPQIARSYKADAIILHDISGGVASVEEIAQLPGKLFRVLHNETVFPDEKEPLFQKKCEFWGKLPMTLVVPTSGMAQKAENAAVFCGMEQIRIPFGVDLSIYHPGNREKVRRELGIPSDVFAVLTNPMQNQTVCKTLCELKKIYGGKIRFIHSMPRSREAVVRLYQACDLLLDGSMLINTPYHILRASACGLPVAAFDFGGMTETVADGWSGRLSPPDDPEALTEAVCDILENTAFFRDGACEHAAASFADMTIARRYCDWVNKVL